MSLSLLLQQSPTCLVHFIWMVLEIGGRWPYTCCFKGCCFQDLFNIACSILVQLSSCFFSIHFVSVHVVHPYSRIDTPAALKKLRFILSDRSDFHMINNLSIAVHTFARHILMSVDEMLLPRYVNFSTNFSELSFSVEIFPSWFLDHISVQIHFLEVYHHGKWNKQAEFKFWLRLIHNHPWGKAWIYISL